MSDVLLRSLPSTFMYRDFQSRNVMIKDGEPWFIDFQGGRKGPFYYDVASSCGRQRRSIPIVSVRNAEGVYRCPAQISAYRRAYFYSQLRHFVLFRTLQVLGAYGFRGLF